MKFVVILAALIAVSYEQAHTTDSGTTHETREPSTTHFHTDYVTSTVPGTTTHEPSESASIFFHYDYLSQKMSLRYGRTCYIFTLSAQQKLQVHTDAGIKALELTLLPLIDSGNKTLVQKSSLSPELQRACGRNTTLIYMMS